MASTVVVPEESRSTGVSWGPIIAGALVASTATVILMLVGSGLGLTMVSPWSGESASLTTFAATTAVWLVVVQWLSSALGGYIAGRMRTKWVALRTDEVFFRDTAHGLLAWALATLLVAGVFASTLSAAIGTGVQAASTVASGAAMGAAANTDDPSGGDMYFVDALFRAPAGGAAAADDGETAAAQASRILVASAAAGSVSAVDQAYLAQLVSARTGLSEADAQARVTEVLARVEAAKVETQQAADTARKAGATAALVGALAMLIGAFIASASAAIGGRLRDDLDALPD